MSSTGNPQRQRETILARRRSMTSGYCFLALWTVYVAVIGRATWWTPAWVAGIAGLVAWPLSPIAAHLAVGARERRER